MGVRTTTLAGLLVAVALTGCTTEAADLAEPPATSGSPTRSTSPGSEDTSDPTPTPSPTPTQAQVVSGPILADANKIDWDAVMDGDDEGLPGIMETFRGSGDDIVDLSSPLSVVLVQVHHRGSSNFVVRPAFDTGSGSSLVNEIGQYTGEMLAYGRGEAQVVGFDVTADGPWVISAANLTLVADGDALSTSYEGVGDSVVGLPVDFDDPQPVTRFSRATVTHEGSSNFVVRVMLGSALVNEIGTYDGTVRLPADGLFGFEITADGAWTLELDE